MNTSRSFRIALVSLALGAAPLLTGCAGATEEGAAEDSLDALAARALAPSYEGTIKNLKVMMRLESRGGAVTGTYFYAGKVTKGEVIALQGTLAGTKLTLEESVGGVKTGTFAGTLAADGSLKGTWSAPGGRSSLPFALTSIKPGAVMPVIRHIMDVAPAATGGGGPMTTCSVDASYVEIFGLANRTVEAAVNAALASGIEPITRNAAGKCDMAFVSETAQTVKLNERGVLVVEESGYENSGGPYPNNLLSYKNISLKTGKVLELTDAFKPGAMPQVKALTTSTIANYLDVDADDKEFLLRAASSAFEHPKTMAFELMKDGIKIVLHDELPHAAQALDGDGTQLGWAELAPLLAPASEAAGLKR